MREDENLIALIIIGSLLILTLLALTVFGFLAFRRSFTRKIYEGDQFEAAVKKVGKRPNYQKYAEGIYWVRDFKEKEEVTIKSHDGLKLFGYYLKNPESNGKVMIMCHGYRSFPWFDFSASAKECYERGFDLLFINERTHGKSEGKYITFGIKEKYDLLRWIDYVSERHNGKAQIILSGVSMGSSVIMYALGENLPDCVKGAVCDCGFDSPKSVIGFALIQVFKSRTVAKFVSNFVSFASFVILGRFLGSENTSKSLPKCNIPVMMAHGKVDDVVPYEMSVKNFEYIKSEKIFVSSEDAPHGQVYFFETEKYLESFDKLLKLSGLSADEGDMR